MDHVLERKGFSVGWRKWMRGCLNLFSFAVLVNGCAKGWMRASKGLQQGDPLSPFIFTIVIDVLSRLLIKAKERRILGGFKVSRNGIPITHLQFANDAIFFSKACSKELDSLKTILLVFRWLSGLNVNLVKSFVTGINVGAVQLKGLVEVLGSKEVG